MTNPSAPGQAQLLKSPLSESYGVGRELVSPSAQVPCSRSVNGCAASQGAGRASPRIRPCGYAVDVLRTIRGGLRSAPSPGFNQTQSRCAAPSAKRYGNADLGRQIG